MSDVSVKKENFEDGVPLKEAEKGAKVEEVKIVSGWTQVRALMEKNALTKLRTPGATAAELLSPVLLMVVLWLAYNMSDVYNVPSKFFHSINVELPLLWHNVTEDNVATDDVQTGWTPSDTHRRHLGVLDLEDEPIEKPTLGKWIQMMGDQEASGGPLEEDFGFVNDILMMSHCKHLLLEEDEDSPQRNLFEIDVIDFDDDDAKKDSGVWWKEMLSDLKKETVDKVDWNELEKEVKDNLGEIWEESRQYILYADNNNAYTRLQQLRRVIHNILQQPLVVPTFGQYVWGSKVLTSFINVRRNIPSVFYDSTYGRQWGNLLTLGTLHLTPQDHPRTFQFKEYLDGKYPAAMKVLTVRTHSNEEEAMQYVMDNLGERTWAVIDLSQLETNDSTSKGGSFKIRMNSTTVPNTALVENYVAMGLSTRYQRYYLSGYLTLQRTINDFVMWHSGCEAQVDPFWSMPMPTAAYEQNVFFLHIGYLLGLVLVMAFLYPTSRLIQGLVEERETRMKETLLILGVRPWAHTASWIFSSVLTFGSITFLMTVALRHILTHTPFMLVWFWMGMFSMASMSFCFFIASFFSKAKLAAVVGPIALFASLLPRFIFFGTNRYEAVTGKFFASILPGTALAFSADIVGDNEYGHQNVGHNIWSGGYSFGSSMSIMAFDAVLYLLLAWYAEKVIPREFGAAPQPWYFPLLWLSPSYWSGYSTSSQKTLAGHIDDDFSFSAEKKSKAVSNNCIEAMTDPSFIPRVLINNLVKRYGKAGDKPAVNNLSLTLYESQITALLGHNGAGKTSTVSVITGLYRPTSGDVSIYGASISSDLARARQSLGICPQHNVLFDRLTVLEHLKFFSMVKGATIDIQDLKARALEIGLTEDQLDTTSAALSGGNKRKLSVAIAMCGNPKVLILDEPTSAMDPTARRRCWQVLRRKRAGRVTLLTTHFMDEAEHLSDRVAVMKEGELQCCGSPLYLKNKYNLGWNLTVVMDKPQDCEDCFDKEYAGSQLRITAFLQQYIPETECTRRSGRELTYSFPKGSEELFPDAFDAFEQQSKDLGVSSYGVENASFEEVFLLLAEKEGGNVTVDKDDEVSAAETGSISTDDESFCVPSMSSSGASDGASMISSKVTASLGDDTESEESSILDGSPEKPKSFKDMGELKGMSPLRQVGLLYWKRVTIQKRDWKGAFFAIIVPVLLVALVVLVLTAKIIVSGPAIEMSPAIYDKTYSANSNGDANSQILVGGGAGAQKDSVFETKYFLETAGTGNDYPNVETTYLSKGVSSSEQLSRYLLNTYNDHDHPVRFGAFAMEDLVLVNVSVDFPAFHQQIRYYEEKRTWDTIKLRDHRVDLLEVFGLDGTNGNHGRFLWRMSVGDIAEKFFAWSSLNPLIRVRTDDLHRLTRTALKNIIDSSSINVTQARSEYEHEMRSLVQQIYDEVMSFITSSDVRSFEDNVTNIFTRFIGEVENAWNASEIESDSEKMLKKLVEDAFAKRKIPEGNEVFHWKGNYDILIRDFWEDVRSFGGNPERNVSSLYDLTENFVMDAVDFGNKTIQQVTNGEYNVSSLGEAILNALRGGNENDEFDREVIEKEISTLIRGVAELYMVYDVDAEDFVHKAIGWVQSRLDEYSNGSIQKIPGKAFVSPLILSDFVLEQWNTTTVSLNEAFGYLSDRLGGSPYQLNGFISVRARDVVVDFGTLAIELEGIYVATGFGTLISIDRDIPFRFALDSLQALAPKSDSIQFYFDVYSRTSLLHNSSSPHAVAVFNQAHMEKLYKQCIGSASNHTSLTSINHPLPLTTRQSLEIKVILSVVAGLFILIPFCYIPATFIVFLVKERISKSKHLQLVSGVNMSAYWVATYLWDMTLYSILTFCIMVVFLLYGSNAEVFIGTTEAFSCTFALIFGYGLSSLPFSYLLSRMFDNCSTAQISVAGIGWLSGFATVISYYTLYSLPKTEHIAVGLQPWFRLFPAYNVGEGFMLMSQSFWESKILGSDQSPADWDVAGLSICYVFWLAVPYFFLVLVLEYADDGGSGGYLGRALRYIQSCFTKLSLHWHGIRTTGGDGVDGTQYALLRDDEGVLKNDEDVTQERRYVLENKDELRQNAPVLLVNLWKIYPPSIGVFGSIISTVRGFFLSLFYGFDRKVSDSGQNHDEEKTFVPKQAVRGVTTAIKKGETYALLGANGAGKTTIMGMLTGDITSTNGTAYIAGHDATGGSNSGVSEARKNIGFCPQKDPLLDLMTGRETLTMFARLRGVPSGQVASLVNELLYQLTLTPHADKVTRAYSGGNKRKLSLGLALIGDPAVLLIDESSSGLDPLAKRKMWDLIEQAARSRSVILTTHSMQEAEALCTRVAIMVKGQFVCLGSVQHLKNKYMDGYSVDIFCKGSASDAVVDQVENEVLYALPGCSVSERCGRFLRFEVANVSCLGLGTCFRRLQELKNNPDLQLENYAVSQCSLEHVFVKLVNDKNDDDDDLEYNRSFTKASF